jgi:hypothetical protein
MRAWNGRRITWSERTLNSSLQVVVGENFILVLILDKRQHWIKPSSALTSSKPHHLLPSFDTSRHQDQTKSLRGDCLDYIIETWCKCRHCQFF